MKTLQGFQRKYLRGLAHGIKPQVMIGQKGITDTVIREIDDSLKIHELIKIKFADFKERDQKKELSSIIEQKTGSQLAGIIGHMAIFYRQHENPEKRKITVPERSSET